MEAVWTDQNKFQKWLEVELAVLKVREQRGELPPGTTEGIAFLTVMNGEIVEAINLREKEISHDLNAFVEAMRILINNEGCMAAEAEFSNALKRGHPKKWDHHFHEGMTSYDTEEPAMALLFRQADAIIIDGCEQVMNALRRLARDHRGTVMIGRTHGQHAQPVTFGKRCLDWLDMVERARNRFMTSSEEVGVMKLSGAVGMYGTLGPEIEQIVAEELDLDVARTATQIIPLDRRAQHLASLAELAAVVEKIARDLWLLSQSEIGEVAEPFGKKQKGSSAMPHKKNPITLEKLFGLPRVVRGYALAMLENVATAHERDISHSSVERIVVPDAYGLTDHLLRQLGRVLEGLQVFPERMKKNLNAAGGVYASQMIRDLLGKHGVAGETAYRFVQKCSFRSMELQLPFAHLFLDMEDEEVPKDLRVTLAETSEFHQALDPKWWVRNEDVYYQRFGL